MLARIAEQFPELRIVGKQFAGQRFQQRDDGLVIVTQCMNLRRQNP